MVDPDILLGKVGVITRCVARIRSVVARKETAPDPIDVQDIVVLNLQRAIQAAIDLATHIVSGENLGVPAGTADYFTRMREAGIIDADAETAMRKMVGFSNVAVHEYDELDPRIIDRIVSHRLDDFERFYTQAITRYLPA